MSETPIFNTIEAAFAYYTECALATAEGLDMRKSSSASDKRRAWSIAKGMVAACARHGVPFPSHWDRLPRLRKAWGVGA